MSSQSQNNGASALTNVVLYSQFQVDPATGVLMGYNPVMQTWVPLGPTPLGTEALIGLANCQSTPDLITLHRNDPLLQILAQRATGTRPDPDAVLYVQELLARSDAAANSTSTAATTTTNNNDCKPPAQPTQPTSTVKQVRFPSNMVPMSPPPQVASLAASTSTSAPAPPPAIAPSGPSNNVQQDAYQTLTTTTGRTFKALRLTREVKTGNKIRSHIVPNPRKTHITDNDAMPSNKKKLNAKWLQERFNTLEAELKASLIDQAQKDGLDMTTGSTFGDDVPQGIRSRDCLTCLKNVLEAHKSFCRKDIGQIALAEFLDFYISEHNVQFAGFSPRDTNYFKNHILSIIDTVHVNYHSNNGQKSPYHLEFALESQLPADSDDSSAS